MTEFLEKLNKAYHLYVTEQYSVALPRFTAIINTSPTYEAYIGRAATLIKLNRIDEALQDSGLAISQDDTRYEAYYYKGVSLFSQGKFALALTEFENAKSKLGESDIHEYANDQIIVWTSKANAEIAQRKTLVDLKLQPRAQIIEEPKKEQVILTNSNTKVETKAEEKKPVVEKEIKQIPVSQVKPSGKIGYVWRQTDSRIYIEIKHVVDKKESLKVKIESKRLEVFFAIDSSKNFELNLDLFDEIIPEASVYNIQLDKIEVILDKKNRGKSWNTLERPETANEIVLETKLPQSIPQPISANQANQASLAYPSSSKSKKDWSKIDKEIDEDMKEHKDEYQDEDPLNKLFKQIYANADENTRRAMMKSFQTSGGTVLSTNWDEVKEKDYSGKDKPSAPDGQEWRKWEK